MTDPREIALIDELRSHAAESEWFEFKGNNVDPAMIGKCVSAISNSARIIDKQVGYMVWGISDKGHNVIGTTFNPDQEKVTQQPLKFWLEKQLNPPPPLVFKSIMYEGKNVVILEIPAATLSPVAFKNVAYVRVGSATPPLHDYLSREKLLWSKLQPFSWESGAAITFLPLTDVFNLLNIESYFKLTNQPKPDDEKDILAILSADKLIEKDIGERWNITNLGALLFATKLDKFPTIVRKSIRIVQYEGSDKNSPVLNRQDGNKGYAAGFEGLVNYISMLLPKREKIGTALREVIPLYPTIAIRETVANALIHQDMTITGAGPTVDIFADRVEITNPGRPLVPPERFIDFPPRSRNEKTASLMRRMNMCEEAGSGIDKTVISIEASELPPPDFRAEDSFTKVILYARRPFSHLTSEERMRACVQHSIIKWISGGRLTNSSLRQRFGIEAKNAAMMSRLINEAVEKGYIKVADPNAPRSGYLPAWA